MRILVVEDELELLETLGHGLELDGYDVDLSPDGEDAMDKIALHSYDLVLLDLNLPGVSGLEVLENAMEYDSNLKVMILTSRGDVDTKVQGLDLGAMDYMVKPFDFVELEARIRSILRRSFKVESKVLEVGDLSFDTVKRVLYAGKNAVVLTRKETLMIEYLMRNSDRIVSAEELFEQAWDTELEFQSNSLRVHLTTLRKKIKDELGYNPIQNRIGEGYFITHDKRR